MLYLTDQCDGDAGGETAFLRAEVSADSDLNGETGFDIDGTDNGSVSEEAEMNGNRGTIKVHPGKGSAVLFYNLLEDGNGDVNSLHAALPVLRGEKWLANLWIWDPALPPLHFS